MRRTLERTERSVLDYQVGAFQLGTELQSRAALAVASILDIGPDEALDALNLYATEGDFIDAFGIETFDAAPPVPDSVEPDNRNWEFEMYLFRAGVALTAACIAAGVIATVWGWL